MHTQCQFCKNWKETNLKLKYGWCKTRLILTEATAGII